MGSELPGGEGQPGGETDGRRALTGDSAWPLVPLATAGSLGQALASLWVPESLMSGHAVGLTMDSKFPNSSEMFYIDGLGIMAGNGRQRAWRWTRTWVRQREDGNKQTNNRDRRMRLPPELQNL